MLKRPTVSGVSQAMHTTNRLLNNDQLLTEKNEQKEFTIKVANTLEEREAAFRLGYQVYLEKGFIRENASECLIQNYDANKETIILIVQDQQKNVAGSITIVFDGDSKLPAEKIYGEEIKSLRKSGCKMAELSRLVIDPSYRNSKEILILLFNYLCIYIHHVKQYSGLTITVNPRHQVYYQTILSFDVMGTEKPCPHVQNAPAVLLYLPTSRYQSEVKRCHEKLIQAKKERTLWQYFIKPEQESLVAHYLAKQVKAMTAEEKIYFGFTESGISRVVCV